MQGLWGSWVVGVAALVGIGQTAPADPAALQATLAQPAPDAALLRALGIVGADGTPCDVDAVALVRSADDMAAVVQVQTGACRTDFLLPFWRVDGKWRPDAALPIENWYGEPVRVELRPLVPGYPPAILVHDVMVDRGSGVSQHNLRGYLRIDGAARLVLDRTTHAHLQVPSTRPGSSFHEEVRSSFRLPTPETLVSDGAVIGEVRRTTVQGRTIVQCRTLAWVEDDKQFRELLCAP
ncbi:hypothetical protein ABIC35_002061 [Sphingomonas trueperi]